MTKRKETKSSEPQTAQKVSVLRLHAADGNEARELAEALLRPNVNAAMTVQHFKSHVHSDGLSLNHLVNVLAAQSEAVNAGRLQRCEAMLASQAHTLDAIFNDLAIRSACNLGNYNQTAEMYMRLALKAQSQCRATIEAIAEMKNPKPIAFVKQANIAHGPQQVNNSENQSLRAGARVRENEIPRNKLLEAENGARMDTRTQGEAINAHSRMEAVG
jgi:hypothetical protein